MVLASLPSCPSGAQICTCDALFYLIPELRIAVTSFSKGMIPESVMESEPKQLKLETAMSRDVGLSRQVLSGPSVALLHG